MLFAKQHGSRFALFAFDKLNSIIEQLMRIVFCSEMYFCGAFVAFLFFHGQTTIKWNKFAHSMSSCLNDFYFICCWHEQMLPTKVTVTHFWQTFFFAFSMFVYKTKKKTSSKFFTTIHTKLVDSISDTFSILNKKRCNSIEILSFFFICFSLFVKVNVCMCDTKASESLYHTANPNVSIQFHFLLIAK